MTQGYGAGGLYCVPGYHGGVCQWQHKAAQGTVSGSISPVNGRCHPGQANPGIHHWFPRRANGAPGTKEGEGVTLRFRTVCRAWGWGALFLTRNWVKL